MSAQSEIETVSWDCIETLTPEFMTPASQIEVESLFRNFDQKNLVAPLREVRAAQERFRESAENSEERRRAALELQAKWERLLVQRELLRNELKRGKEVLEHTQRELGLLRSRLEEWQSFERVCGKNPLLDYMHAMLAHEKVEQFLPSWLQRREAQLASLNLTLEETARQTGLEHLL